MATVQPLRGGSDKIFSISNNFNQGIDKRTADDVSSDQSFADLTNFYNAAEGYLIKDGEITTPLRDVSLSGNILETLKNIIYTKKILLKLKKITGKY